MHKIKTYNERSSLVLIGNNIHDGFCIKFDIVFFVEGEVCISSIPISNYSHFILIVASPQCYGGVILQPSHLSNVRIIKIFRFSIITDKQFHLIMPELHICLCPSQFTYVQLLFILSNPYHCNDHKREHMFYLF